MAAGPASRSNGAKALLYTLLGEFVLPADGAVWTSSLVAGLGRLGVGERNARQAIARVAEQGVLASERIGRSTRWHLTPSGHQLLETGAARIYAFGEPYEWGGEWLVVHCPVPETKRPVRHRLRTRLAFEGFGELAPSLAVSPHVEREAAVREILRGLDLGDDSVLLRSRTGSKAADRDLIARAWELDALADRYRGFIDAFGHQRPESDEARFSATIRLVHHWRGFPFSDPELPPGLLPPDWPGVPAAHRFRDLRAEWGDGARRWFDEQEGAAASSSR